MRENWLQEACRVRLMSRPCNRMTMPWWILVWTALVVIAAGAAWIACPAWLTGGESASTTLRNLGLIVAAAIGLPLAMWRSAVAERQADAARRQSDTAVQMLLNDRFQKAAEMLGNADVESVRVGGIHALARLAREYPDSFHIPVMELFSAFVVDRTRGEAVDRVGWWEGSETPGDEEQREPEADEVANDERNEGKRDAPWFETATVEHGGPFFVADRKVGPIPELENDFKAVMSQIAKRSETQIS